jgi:DNA polymerase/3'-5' exonuclease PolX
LELARVFKELGNLHQECPLLPVDTWKAYCFRVVAGRIQNLDFEISHDTLDRLRRIKGIGASSADKAREYLETGNLSRIKEIKTDPRRIAMKQMMDIWGVGRIKVSTVVLVFEYAVAIETKIDCETWGGLETGIASGGRLANFLFI